MGLLRSRNLDIIGTGLHSFKFIVKEFIDASYGGVSYSTSSEKKYILKTFIYMYEMSFIYEELNTLPIILCDHIIKEYENDDTKELGRVGVDRIVVTALKKSLDLQFKIGSKWDAIHLTLREIVLKSLQKYYKHLNDNVLHSIGGMGNILDPILGNQTIMTGMQIQKYEVGDYFKWHIDGSKNTPQRILAFIIYLNTMEDGCGGETEFIDGTIIRPEIGKLIFFPTTWTNIHRSVEIKSCSKYIITGFVLNSVSM